MGRGEVGIKFEAHGVSFREAATVFDDMLSITVPDRTIRLMRHAMSLSAFRTKAGC